MTTTYSRHLLLLLLSFTTIVVRDTTAEPPQTTTAVPAPSVVGVVKPYVDRKELAGAVMLVATKDRVVMLDSVGYSDIAKDQPMRPDSLFWIASQSKPITATALMILVDQKKVSLEDPVEKYLPEFKGQMVVKEKDDDHVVLHKPVHPITIRNILTHTSGLPFKSRLEEPTLDRFSLEARVRSYAMTPLDFEPDSKYLYSNAGINTAARVIEVVTGKLFEAFLDEQLFQPLGMTDTTFWPTEEQAVRIAVAYQPGPNRQGLEPTTISQLHYPLTDRHERFPMPAGGLFSTAHDIGRFYRMLLNGGELDGRRYLSPDSVNELTTRHTPAEWRDSYGLGFAVGRTFFGHGGAYHTNTSADKSNGLILVWLVQHGAFPGEGVTAQNTFREKAVKEFGTKK